MVKASSESLKRLSDVMVFRRVKDGATMEIPMNLFSPGFIELMADYYSAMTLAGNRHCIEDAEAGFFVPFHPIEGVGL